jgi:hypothetical protein
MSATTWTVDVDGVRRTISVERDAKTGRTMIRVDGRMVARPMSEEEEERQVPVGGTIYVIRRIGEDKFDLDVPPETFLSSAPKTMARGSIRSREKQESSGSGRKIGAAIGGTIVILIVLALLRVGREGFAYMRVPWKPFKPADGSFSVNFAGDPKQETESMNLLGDMWNIVSYQSKYKNHFYVVQYIDTHAVVTEKNAPNLLSQYLDGWMDALEAKLQTKEPASLSRNPAIRFVADVPKGAGKGDQRLPVDAVMRGTIAMRGRRILVAWTLAGKGDRIVADLTKFLESFEIPPPPPRSETVIAAEETPRTLAPVTETRTDTAPAPAHTDIAMTTTVTRVYASNKTRKYYPLDCKAAPPDAFPMAKSLAVKQGFTPAPECPQ